MEANYIPGVATLDGRMCVGNRNTMLHTKYIRCGPDGFRKEEFVLFLFFF